MKLKKLEDIKDQTLLKMLNDSTFIELWKEKLNDEKATSAIMKITITNDKGEKIIYNTELDFIKKKGTILSKEIIKKEK